MSAQKIFVILFLLFLAVLLPAKSVVAQISPDQYKAAEHAGFTWTNFEFGLICDVGGVSTVTNRQCPFYQSDGSVSLASRLPNGGALGGVSKVMVALYQSPPTSTSLYNRTANLCRIIFFS